LRIISKFKDYYDVNLRYGIDPNCVYVRNPVQFDVREKEGKIAIDRILSIDLVQNVLSARPWDSPRYDEMSIVLFCGKLYVCFGILIPGVSKFTQHYTSESVMTYYQTRGEAAFIPEFMRPPKDRFSDSKKPFEKWYLDSFFEMWQGGSSSQIVDAMHEVSVPVICLRFPMFAPRTSSVYRYCVMLYNPSLRMLEFYKMIEPTTAFQELSMFISGVLGGQSPSMVKVSDTVRLEKHGFDAKTSFRKMKEVSKGRS
jgi:hypothetical protein